MKHLAVLLICLIILVPSLAQDAPPTVTPENAASLTLLDSVGSALPTGVQFSPDGRYILATTTDETFVFPADDLDAEPQIFPFNQIAFDADGDLIGGGQRWNLDTGQSIGIAPSIRVIRQNENAPAIIEIEQPTGGTIVMQTIITESITHLAVDDAYRVLAVAINGNYLRGISATTYIYGLPQGNLIAAIPDPNDFPITRLHFVGSNGRGSLFIESTANFETPQGYVTVINLPSGRLNDFYSGTIWDGIRFSPGGRFAYALEDKIVHSAGYEKYDRQGIFGTPEFFAVTDSGIAAIFGDDVLRLARFRSDGRLSDFEAVPLGSRGPHRLTTAGHHVVLNDDGVLRVWDLRSGSLQPTEIALDPSVANNRTVQLSPDLARYSYHVEDQLYVRDTATHELLAELPETVIISPDWSRAAYFDGKRLTVDDFADEQDYLREVNPRHLGEVADFQNGYAAFIGDSLQVVDLDPADGHTDKVIMEGAFDGAQFFGGGTCIVTFAPSNGGSSDLVTHRLNTEAGCDPEEYRTNLDARASVVTPDGRFLVGYSTYCDSPYGYPSANIYPLRGQPPGELSNMLLHIMLGCGKHAFAFAPDGVTIYYADSMLRRGRFDMDGSMLSGEDIGTLLDYGDPVDYSFASIASVFLSPDEEKIAVYVEDSNGSETVQERYIEIFALDDLAPGTLRRDVRPLQTIPDATVVSFSPNGDYVVTDKGLYSVKFANQTPAVNGAISAFSPDGQVLATYQADFVTLWRVPQPEANNVPLAQYDIRGVRELAFSADGTRLFVVRDGEVQVWGIAN